MYIEEFWPLGELQCQKIFHQLMNLYLVKIEGTYVLYL